MPKRNGSRQARASASSADKAQQIAAKVVPTKANPKGNRAERREAAKEAKKQGR